MRFWPRPLNKKRIISKFVDYPFILDEEWLAAMCSHIPDRGESRRWREYYGYYSNVSREKRKETKDDVVPYRI